MDHISFAEAFAEALRAFLDQSNISQSDAVRRLGLEFGKGKARLNKYCNDSSRNKRPVPDAEILYLLCTKLGFEFAYSGYKISAATLNGGPARRNIESPVEQLVIEFDGEFGLTDQGGTFTVGVKRPPGRIELAITLMGQSSRK
jgi:transcriptional regulator with XRE-family HTH domain